MTQSPLSASVPDSPAAPAGEWHGTADAPLPDPLRFSDPHSRMPGFPNRMEEQMETQAPYVTLIPGVTGPAINESDNRVHLSYLPEVHGAVAAAVPANRVLGVDVSHWNAKRDVIPIRHMDWAKCKEAGAKFAFIRAGSITALSGELYEDFEFRYNRDTAPQFMPVGYYWYFRPNHDPIAQANYFIDLIEMTCYKLYPWVDIEVDGGLTPHRVADQLQLFVERMGYLLEYPTVYTRGWWWNDNVASRVLWSNLDLAIARYVNLPEPWGNPGDQEKLRPYDWEDWLFWQWSADGNGRGAEFGAQSNSIDLDWYNGNQNDFEDEFGIGLTDAEKLARLWQAHPELWEV